MMKRLFLLVMAIAMGQAAAGQSVPSDSLYSPAAAALMSKVGMDAYAADPYEEQTVEVTMTFLESSLSLDEQIGTSWENLLKVSASGMAHARDYSIQIRDALRHYVDQRSNLAVIDQAVAYLLGRLNTRAEREEMLAKLLNIYQDRNLALVSELLTQMALLELERADFQGAYQHLAGAYRANPYNALAFSKLVELNDVSESQMSPVLFVVQLRRGLEANPFDLDIALAYADLLRQVELFESAQKAYQYAADLHAFVYPGQPQPIDILLPWSLCAFQSERSQGQCVVLADQAQSDGRFSLPLEAAAGLALVQMGRPEAGQQRLETAARQAAERIKQNTGDVLAEQLCWFTCFALADPERALAWGHEAISQRPDAPQTRALFAYALVSNGQDELAREYLPEPVADDPVALFAKARILLNEDKPSEALPLLKRVVERGPETLIAQRADAVLKANHSEYVSAIVPSQVLTVLTNEFGEEAVAQFLPISRLLKAKLSISGSEYLYGSDLQASIVIENIGPRRLILRNTGMFTGRVRIDAEVRGDIQQSIPSVVSTEIRPGRVVAPGEHASMSVDLMSGPLRTLLRTYPQASLDIEFTLWLDPVEDALGKTQNRWSDLAPDRQRIKRRGIELTRDFLMQRLSGVARGQEGQKYRSAELFTGLLAEQHAARQGQVGYRFVQAQPALLLDAIRRLLADEDWLTRLQTLSTFTDVTVSMDGSLLGSIAENLSHDRWPVRLMALYILSRTHSDNFEQVLDWHAKHDPSALTRQMAAALGGRQASERGTAVAETTP